MKYLFANGCSFTYGDELKNKFDDRWSYILSNKLNLEEINIAHDGASNDRILRSTIDWISYNTDKLKDTFFIIGWTGPERWEEWLDASISKFNVQGYKPNCKLTEYGRGGKYYMLNFYHPAIRMLEAYRTILTLQQILKSYNCKFLFFSALEKIWDFNDEDSFPIEERSRLNFSDGSHTYFTNTSDERKQNRKKQPYLRFNSAELEDYVVDTWECVPANPHLHPKHDPANYYLVDNYKNILDLLDKEKYINQVFDLETKNRAPKGHPSKGDHKDWADMLYSNIKNEIVK
jgi:hypothetical protein